MSSGVIVTWLKARKDLQLKKMDQNETERLEIRKDLSALEAKFDDLYGKYLEVLKDNRLMSAEQEILRRRVQELSGYKSQAHRLNRLTKVLHNYHQTQNVKALIDALDKELLK